MSNLQARKAALLAQTFSKDDPLHQARLEKEAKDEDNEIRKVCSDLSLEIYEVCFLAKALSWFNF